MSPPLTTATLLGTPGVIGVYNSTQLNCSDFRNESTKAFFRIWPESIYNFSYCCEDGSDHKFSLFNFTYSRNGARIISRPYFDLGYVETRFSPYWKQWRFWQVPQRKIVVDNFKCDFTDLHHLYTYRFWTKVMRDGAILSCKIIALLQAVVIASVMLKWLWNYYSPNEKEPLRSQIKSNLNRWWNTKPRWEDWISDLLHMYLIVTVGGALIEGTGHSDPTKWRAIILYNTAVVYTWMTLVCMVSTALRQVTVAWIDEDDEEEQALVRYSRKQKTRPKRNLFKITEDWRWQRVFGQLAVLILIGTYLMFVDDDSGSSMDNIAALMFAAVVVACMWSGGVGLVVTARAIAHIFRHLFHPPNKKEMDIEKFNE